MNLPYHRGHTPPAPALNLRVSATGEAPRAEPVWAMIDTGADGTLIPSHILSEAEAVNTGDATLHGILGDAREVFLFDVDLHLDTLVIPAVTVIADDFGDEVLLGRNVLNKLVILLDGPNESTDLFESRPTFRQP